MKTKPGKASLRVIQAACLAALLGTAAPAWSYTAKVVVSMPTNTAGAKPAASFPTNTKITPCNDATKIDGVTFTVTYDATGSTKTIDRDVYVIFYNADAATKFFTVQKPKLGSTTFLTARADVAALNANKATDIYVAKAGNPGSQTETILGSFIPVDGVDTGTWQLVAIIADSAAVDFDNPATWDAWDVGTVMFAKPWKGAALQSCL